MCVCVCVSLSLSLYIYIYIYVYINNSWAIFVLIRLVGLSRPPKSSTTAGGPQCDLVNRSDDRTELPWANDLHDLDTMFISSREAAKIYKGSVLAREYRVAPGHQKRDDHSVN